MGRISQAYKRRGQLDARHEASSTSSDSIFSAYAPEPHTEADESGGAGRAAGRHVGSTRSVLTAVPAHGASSFPTPSPWQRTPSALPPEQVSPGVPAAVTGASTAENDIDRLLDLEQVGNYLGFIARSAGRRWRLAAGVVLVMMGAVTAAAVLWPKAYHVDAKLLVQRNDVMASLVNPGRTIAREAEEPTRAAEEIVHQHDNLLSVIKQTDLMNRWEKTRTPLLKTKDRVMAKVSGPKSDADRLDGLVGLLEERVKVFATPEGTVTFDITWPDPQMAYDIVDRVIQNFLQFRRVSETSAIADSIAILDQSVQTLEEQVTQTIAELPKRPTRTIRRSEPAPAPAVVASTPAPTVPSGPPADIVRRVAKLRADLETRRQEVARLDEAHRAQLADAQARLTAAKMVYGDDFPAVIALRQTVTQLSRESPELLNLRRDVQNLESEYDTLTTAVQNADEAAQRTAGTSLPTSEGSAQRPRTQPAPFELDVSGMTGAEASDPTSLRLKVELAELAAVRERANAARAELSSSQAGFKYQYKVIRPPQLPRRPSSPSVPLWLGAGAVASVLLALLAAVAADLASGRILEPWQVEHQLGVPVAVKLQE